MSPPLPDEGIAGPPQQRGSGGGRLARLTLKEMRETLRDRRTLITLVLMPFLLYPLLSLVLRKFLLTGLIATGVPTYYVNFASANDEAILGQLISQGEQLLIQRQPGEQHPVLRIKPTEDNELGLRRGEVDVVARITRPPPPLGKPVTSWEVDCELLVLEGSLTGERAARYLEDCLRAYGSMVVRQRLRAAGIRQRPTPILPLTKKLAEKSSSSVVSLPALIPFVLILMTITGAVYPAIDLTAGERERGTLELLIAAPVPRLALLFAKYVAVLTVAVLTASVNLLAMSGTILFSGLGPMVWGTRGLSFGTVAAVFCLLLLLASFFAAVLLTITSFARSFKEAQAYLIPLMLCALGPGLISLMPGVEMGGWLAVMPLLNVALLARDILQGEASVLLGTVVVASTVLYAFAALALAAKLFAADAVLYDARLGWSELWRRPSQPAPAGVAIVLLCLACMFPISFAANGSIATLTHWDIGGKLAAMAVATALVFGGVPLIFAYWRRVPWQTSFQLQWPHPVNWLAAALLGVSLWPWAHEITLATKALGLVSLEAEQFTRAKQLVEQCRTVPVWLVLLAIALAPAIFEEFCFRGFVLRGLRSARRPWPAILFSGILFGAFHLVATDALAVERLVPSTLLGIVLGWVCLRTRSLFPGMVLHALHNGLLTLLLYYLPEIEARGWGVAEQSHLPASWLLVSAVGGAAGFALIWISSKRSRLVAQHSAFV